MGKNFFRICFIGLCVIALGMSSCNSYGETEIQLRPTSEMNVAIDPYDIPTEILLTPYEINSAFQGTEIWMAAIPPTMFSPEYAQSFGSYSYYLKEDINSLYHMEQQIWVLSDNVNMQEFLDDYYTETTGGRLVQEGENHLENLVVEPNGVDNFFMRGDHIENFEMYSIDFLITKNNIATSLMLRISDDTKPETIYSIVNNIVGKLNYYGN